MNNIHMKYMDNQVHWYRSNPSETRFQQSSIIIFEETGTTLDLVIVIESLPYYDGGTGINHKA